MKRLGIEQLFCPSLRVVFRGVLKSAQGLLSVPVVAMVRLLSRVPVCESTGENKVIETTIDDLNSEILPY
ncbi:MAG: LarC family nickel insertion protein [Firmicutes bacterium]|nr:LarC family nickel insertion protein [Bacillota bacterium]